MAKYNWDKLRQKLANGSYKNLKEFCDKNKVLYNGTARKELGGILAEKRQIKDKIKTEIVEKKEEILENELNKVESTIKDLINNEIALKERVLQERARLAFVDIRKLYNPDGSLKRIHELDDDTAAAIAGIETEVKKVGDEELNVSLITKKIKQYDKNKSLDALDKMLGLYEKDNKQKAIQFNFDSYNAALDELINEAKNNQTGRMET